MKTFLLLSLVITHHFVVHAQKGHPAKQPTSANVHTYFAAHQDFQPSLVSKLKVPTGFRVQVAASGLGKPRMMAVGANNSLYITRRDVGDVLLLQQMDANGQFQSLKTIVAQFNGVHGITIHDGWLYLCATKKLTRGKLNADGTVGPLDTLINDLPDGGQHDNRTIAFGPDNKLYVTVGSDCNDCKETNPEHATILQMNADGTERVVYARGLRNTLGFDWHPQTRELWGMDHGTDWRGDEIPPEELNKIVKNGDYGWPLVFGKQTVDPTREDPVGSTKEAYAKTTQPAVWLFPAHAAPIDFRFLGNAPQANYPAGYATDALVTWHGSWNRQQPEGFKVQRIRFVNGQPIAVEDFLTGFFDPVAKTRFGRPAGLAIAPNGVIFISDDAGGVVYAVTTTATTAKN
ncbi:PQQ-dependent sugar dehydrogenase [Paraflavitalea pollutisoli]|uniref:PQQ-dependent sugar dehydrogenase n=1 Tax=Paraflavitalea pollutisoli TaxID=3034143 RepID=UPI0023ED7E9B|nr:PQQ-dependent sugar dehydrogenase [Paraflavitalea sp. H1-2-19X]